MAKVTITLLWILISFTWADSWKRVSPQFAAGDLESIAYGHDYVITSDSGVLRSSDGITWTQDSIRVVGGVKKVIAKDSAYLLLTNLGQLWLDSGDGEWTEEDVTGLGGIHDIVSSSLGWVLSSANGLYTSVDGVAWTLTLANFSPRVLHAHKNYLYAASTMNEMYRSQNGVQWDTIALDARYSNGNALDLCVNDEVAILAPYPSNFGYTTRVKLDSGWSQVYGMPSVGTSNALHCNESGFSAVGGFENSIGVSQDGAQWSQWELGGETELYGVLRVGDTSWVIGEESLVITLIDDATLEFNNVSGAFDWHDVDTAFGAIWAVSEYGYVVKSEDGENWSLFAKSSFHWRSISSNGSVAVMATSKGHVWVSSDGVTWDTASIGIASNTDLAKMMWADDQFVAMDFGGTVFSSINGLSWDTLGTLGSRGMMLDFTEHNSIFVAVGWPNLIYTSNGGQTWTNHSRTLSTSRSFEAVGWGEAGFVVVQPDSTWRSLDGEIWVASSGGGNVNDIQWDGNRYIALGRDYITSVDGIHWLPLAFPSEKWVYALYAGPQGYVAACRWADMWYVGAGQLEVPTLLQRPVPKPLRNQRKIFQFDLLGRQR